MAAETLDSPGLTLCGLDGLEDEEVVRRVVQLRGVGRWTAQWLLIRGLGRPDALPLGDLALRRVVSQLYFDNQPVDDRLVEDLLPPVVALAKLRHGLLVRRAGDEEWRRRR